MEKAENKQSGWNVAEDYLRNLMLDNFVLYNSLMINENYEGAYRVMQQLVNNFSPYLEIKKSSYNNKKENYVKEIDDIMVIIEKNIFDKLRFSKDINSKNTYLVNLSLGVTDLNKVQRLVLKCMNDCNTLLPMARKMGIQEQIGSS